MEHKMFLNNVTHNSPKLSLSLPKRKGQFIYKLPFSFQKFTDLQIKPHFVKISWLWIRNVWISSNFI